MGLSWLFVVVYVAFVIERLFELDLNRRNSRKLAARGAVWLAKDGFGLIVLSQFVLFVGVAAEVVMTDHAGDQWWTWPAVVGLVLAQALRYWAITTLGERWAVRVVTVPDAPRIVGGPYRVYPHPNYVAVMAEAVLLPLAFGAFATLVVVAPLAFVALVRRIRLEESALGASFTPRS